MAKILILLNPGTKSFNATQSTNISIMYELWFLQALAGCHCTRVQENEHSFKVAFMNLKLKMSL